MRKEYNDTRENVVEMRNAIESFATIADHAEHVHDAPCVAQAMGEWLATLMMFLVTRNVLTTDDVTTLAQSLVASEGQDEPNDSPIMEVVTPW